MIVEVDGDVVDVVDGIVVVVVAATKIFDADEVETSCVASPAYSTVTECVAAASELTEILHVAEANVHVPSVVPPFLNVRVPVAVDGDTTPVNVTAAPTVREELLTVNELVVVMGATVTVIGDDVALEYVVSPA